MVFAQIIKDKKSVSFAKNSENLHALVSGDTVKRYLLQTTQMWQEVIYIEFNRKYFAKPYINAY